MAIRKAPTTEKKTAYEGCPQQQSFDIQVPNAVSVKDIEKATKIGGTTTVTINPGGGSSSPDSSVANNDTTPSKPKPVKKGKRLVESLAFCKQTKRNQDKWFCEGRTQKMWTSVGLDKALISENLSGAVISLDGSIFPRLFWRIAGSFLSRA
ncbi:hypothetical protein [uncultured Amphritea sp.]|uniref:hypothetical protein n=1 Tax=uncultured Amphritea sp. TaxID=981605 RepID=UPI0026039140|nr:hypothetical protein [uncultured Amphritea sp.]